MEAQQPLHFPTEHMEIVKRGIDAPLDLIITTSLLLLLAAQQMQAFTLQLDLMFRDLAQEELISQTLFELAALIALLENTAQALK